MAFFLPFRIILFVAPFIVREGEEIAKTMPTGTPVLEAMAMFRPLVLLLMLRHVALQTPASAPFMAVHVRL